MPNAKYENPPELSILTRPYFGNRWCEWCEEKKATIHIKCLQLIEEGCNGYYCSSCVREEIDVIQEMYSEKYGSFCIICNTEYDGIDEFYCPVCIENGRQDKILEELITIYTSDRNNEMAFNNYINYKRQI